MLIYTDVPYGTEKHIYVVADVGEYIYAEEIYDFNKNFKDRNTKFIGLIENLTEEIKAGAVAHIL